MADYLNLNYLHTFSVAAKTGKLTTTADIVYLSHSAVSTQIKKIEARIGAPLFIRHKDTLTLTHTGELLLEYANRMLELNADAVKKLNRSSHPHTLTIGIPTDYADFYTRFIYPKLAKALPDYSFSTVCSRSRIIRGEIAKGNIDFALAAMEPQYSQDILLWQESLHWVCGNGFHPDSEQPLPVALFADNCVDNDYALYSLRKSQKDFKITFTSTMMDNLASCVKQGIAVALLPQTLITSDFDLVPEAYLTCPFTLKIGSTWNHQNPLDSVILKKLQACTEKAVQESYQLD